MCAEFFNSVQFTDLVQPTQIHDGDSSSVLDMRVASARLNCSLTGDVMVDEYVCAAQYIHSADDQATADNRYRHHHLHVNRETDTDLLIIGLHSLICTGQFSGPGKAIGPPYVRLCPDNI